MIDIQTAFWVSAKQIMYFSYEFNAFFFKRKTLESNASN